MKALKKLVICGLILSVPLFSYGAGSVSITGTITTSNSEQNIIDGGQTIILSLTDATWAASIEDSLSSWQSAFSSSGSWSEISSSLSTSDFSRVNDTAFVITLPASSLYAIWANEVVTLTIPNSLLATGSALNTPTFTIINQSPIISINAISSILVNNDESFIIAGLQTIIIDVARDNWATSLGANNAVTTAFINAIDGDQSWSAVDGPLSYTNISRTSETRVTITLPAAATYVITENEIVTFSFPGSSYRNSSVKAVSDPTVTIYDLNPVVTLSGTALPTLTESNIRAGGYTVIYDVIYDTWATNLDENNATTTEFLEGLTGNQDWLTVTDLLDFTNLTRNSASRVTLLLPAVPSYAISSNETVSASIPASAFNGISGASAGAAFTVSNQEAGTNVTWSTGTSTITEAQVRSGVPPLTLTLDLTSSDSWITSIPTLKTNFIAALSNGAGSEWDTKVLPNISVNRSSATRLVISFTAAAGFDITSLRTITYSISDNSLIASSGASVTPATSGFSISPSPPSLSLSPGSISEAGLNGGSIDLTISEDVFTDPSSVDENYFTISAPAGTSISTVTNRTSTGVRLTLAYEGDIDTDGSIQITIVNGLAGGGTLISNSTSVVAVIEPVITAVSIPNQTYKISDAIPVTITVQDDGGQIFTLTSGSVGGRTLSGFSRINSTTYSASFTVLSGTTDYPALSDIPVSVQLQISGRPGNLFNTPISQSADLIDANPPVINSYQALGGVHKAGDVIQLIVSADQAGYTIDNTQTSINGIPITNPSFAFISEAGGTYYLSYQISVNDIDVPTPAALSGQIVLKDPAGNSSLVKNVSAVSGTFSIDAHSPIISGVTAPDSIYISGETLILTINSDGEGYSLSPETFINGISFSSGRFSLIGTGPVYTLYYPVLATDAEVSAGNLSVNIVLRDVAGNKSNALTSFSNNVSVFTTKPTAFISGNASICKGDSAILYVSLTGKSKWNIVVSNGSSTTNYNDISSSPFSFKIGPGVNTNYTVQTITDKNGLTNTGTGTASIIVNIGTPVNINPVGSAYNLLASPVQLSAVPSGGLFSGPGVVSSVNKFYPDIAGVPNSPHTIIYTYTNGFGCKSYDSISVGVVEASGGIELDDLYCYNDEPFLAAAITDSTEIIGRFELFFKESIVQEGNGIHDNGNNTALITPSLLNPGEYLLRYKYFLKDTLTLEENFIIEFIEQPKFLGFPDPATICQNEVPLNLQGDARRGEFTGLGITGNSASGFKFDPSITGHGRFTITYTDSTVNRCKNQISKDITVYYVPDMGFTASDSCVFSFNPGSEIFFNNTTVEKDSIKSWFWNFDDVNSGSSNFSTLQSPTHFFNKSGKYSISLIDTTTNGCPDRHEITFDFGDKPTGGFEVVNKCFTVGTLTEFNSLTSSNDGIKDYYWKIHMGEGIQADTVISSDTYNFQFLQEGKYLIEHIVTSNTNCTLALSDSIILKPTIVVKKGIPHNELDLFEGGWSSSNSMDMAYPGLSWRWGIPDFISLAGGTEKAWYTQRSNSMLPELSSLISSCFNISELDRPMIKMDIFRNFGSTQDAAILETSTDNGENWNALGNPGDGINWYSDYQTTNFAFSKNYGWANSSGSVPDTSWIESRHVLDPVIGSSNLQFRLVFGAEESTVPDYEGFAFRNITISERNRFSVLEHFVNTTSVNPVKDKVKSANIKVNALYKKDFLYKDFVKLEYHTRFPSVNDPINLFNRDVPGARAYYYGVTTVPYSLLDGGDRTGRRFDFSDTKFEPKEIDINLRSLVDPALKINVIAQENGDDLNIGVKLTALENLPAEERVLYVVLYETIVSGIVAENGELQFQNVVRNMIPDAGGTTIYQAFSATPEDTTQLEYNFSASLNNLDKDYIRVAVYFQNDFSGEIYQAALSDYSRSIGTKVNPEIKFENGLSVYPNPAADFVEVHISGAVSRPSRLEFFDQLGRKVHSESIQSYENRLIINTSGFTRGIYHLRITRDGIQNSEIVKLVIIN